MVILIQGTHGHESRLKFFSKLLQIFDVHKDSRYKISFVHEDTLCIGPNKRAGQ